MATVLLQAAGAALGGVFGPVGAMAGRALGALAGSAVDQALLAPGTSPSGRLSTARIAGPEEGTAIPRLYGTARLGGTLIWATRFQETVTSERGGGKGGRRSEAYAYSAHIALGICEGPIAGIRRIFADGRELDLDGIDYRIHLGTATQLPDPLIEAKQGAGLAPAFRGLAYAVFENLPLGRFGNRIPVLEFEAIRPVGALEGAIRAVTVIPGATEHGYQPAVVSDRPAGGEARFLNRNTLCGHSDWTASLDELQALCPRLESVSLVVAWFGSDLDANRCTVLPGVETRERKGESMVWGVSGLTRSDARLVSRSGGGPAYGGTPDDASVIAAIADLKARGLKIFLNPFLLMDIPARNSLPDPEGAGAQAPYPWRGRITCLPAPGRPSSPDRTAAIGPIIGRFWGNATPGDFQVEGGSVRYAGTGGGYARMLLHYAHLARAAGGVDGFIIGSELRGLTTLRDETGAFPFVDRLGALAGQVKAVLGRGTAVTYGADWSEYSGYQLPERSGDIVFHLDPLWASPDIDAVGIDNYMPLADFRDADLAAGHPDGFVHQEDPAALVRGITSGERFDWYYASDADRAARRRSLISDGLAGKRWVYAPKDIEGWWSNRHFNRIGGREAAAPTAWLARQKPVWFTEIGCPAIDRGANQPNVFLDPKSSESFVPWHSRGHRADSAQRRFLEAHHRHWSGPAAPAGMVAPDRLFVWCWDARPYPAFPRAQAVWSDGPNWQAGHWLNGRLGAGTLADVLAALLADHGFADFDVSGVTGDLAGYVKSEAVSARAMIEPLLGAFQVDVVEDQGVLRFFSRLERSATPLPLAVLAERADEPPVADIRAKAEDIAAEVLIAYRDPVLDHEQAVARARRATPAGAGPDRPSPAPAGAMLQLALPAALDRGQAAALAENLLRDQRLLRRTLRLAAPPGMLALQPGDAITLPEGPRGRFLVTRVEEGARAGEGLLVEAREWAPLAAPDRRPDPPPARVERLAPNAGFDPEMLFLDLPRTGDGPAGSFARVAAFSRPWTPIALSDSLLGAAADEGYHAKLVLERPAQCGRLAAPLEGSAVRGRFDRGRQVLADFLFGAPSSLPEVAVLAGANRLAVMAPDGTVEVLGFADAQEVSPGRFRLRTLLNGLHGSDDAMRAGAPAGSAVLLLDGAVASLGIESGALGLARSYRAEQLGLRHATAGPFRFAGGLRAERPHSPVHPRAMAGPDGVALSWIRRGRIDADSWQAGDIPLDEAAEAYRLDILGPDGSVRRTVTTAQPRHFYPAAAMAADLGAGARSLGLRISQLGRTGPGLALTARLSL